MRALVYCGGAVLFAATLAAQQPPAARPAAPPVGGLGGLTVAHELQTRTPRLKVLYMSGYSDHAILRQAVLEPGVNFLTKPFSAEALIALVRRTLDSYVGSQKS